MASVMVDSVGAGAGIRRLPTGGCICLLIMHGKLTWGSQWTSEPGKLRGVAAFPLGDKQPLATHEGPGDTRVPCLFRAQLGAVSTRKDPGCANYFCPPAGTGVRAEESHCEVRGLLGCRLCYLNTLLCELEHRK